MARVGTYCKRSGKQWINTRMSRRCSGVKFCTEDGSDCKICKVSELGKGAWGIGRWAVSQSLESDSVGSVIINAALRRRRGSDSVIVGDAFSRRW